MWLEFIHQTKEQICVTQFNALSVEKQPGMVAVNTLKKRLHHTLKNSVATADKNLNEKRSDISRLSVFRSYIRASSGAFTLDDEQRFLRTRAQRFFRLFLCVVGERCRFDDWESPDIHLNQVGRLDCAYSDAVAFRGVNKKVFVHTA